MFEDFLSLTQLFLVAAGYLIVCLFFLWLAVQGSLEVASFHERRRAHKHEHEMIRRQISSVEKIRFNARYGNTQLMDVNSMYPPKSHVRTDKFFNTIQEMQNDFS